jgi:hypothetical protein
MPFLELFDETLDLNSTENYELTLQLSPDGLSFCLYDTIRNKFVLIRVFEPEENKYLNFDKIKDLIIKDDFITRRYKKVHILTPTPRVTLVPAPLFDPGKKDDYFTFNHLREEGSIIIANKSSDPDVFILFELSGRLNHLINEFFPRVHPNHQMRPLFEHILHSRKSVIGNYIHIHVEKEYFNLIIFNLNLLKFCNTYNYRNISDILYFVLNVFRKLDIKQDETIFFSGLTEKYDSLSSNLAMYVRNIKFSEPVGNFTFSYVFNDTELHKYLNLFTILNCE